MNHINAWAEKIISRRGHRGLRRGTQSLPPRSLREPQRPLRLESCRSLAATLIVLVAATAIAAQQIGNPTMQQGITGMRGVFIIRNAHIVTVSGPEIENGSMVIRDGKIEAVGTSVTVPRGAQEIDARGLTVYPGMIDAGTAMGLVEGGQGASGTVDTAEVGDMNPNAQAIVAVNAHSAHIGVTRVDGVTSVVSLPQGGIISGQAALINLNGTTPREMAVFPLDAFVNDYPRATTVCGDREFSTETQGNPNITVT